MDISRPPKWKRLLKTAALALAAGLTLALVTGYLVQRNRDARFRAQHPPPGSFVQVDGHRLHYRLSGSGEFTFVLEAGLGGYSGSWGPLESSLAGIGRVLVYDRAGLGWSEASPHPRTAQRIAAELHGLLKQAQIPPPYILVGHSSGGLSQVRFVMDHPAGVAGLLLIDPSHKDQFKRLPPAPFIFTHLLPQLIRTAPVGLPQLLAGSADPVQNQARHVQATGAELRGILHMASTWGDRPLALGRMPIYVLTAGNTTILPDGSEAENMAALAIVKTLHAELVAGSSSGIRRHLVVEGAPHHIHQTHPSAVVDAAREMTARIRAEANQ